MAAEAVRGALADAGLTPADVDGITCFQAGDSASALSVAYAIGCEDVGWCPDISGGGNVVISVVANAAAMVATGDANTVVMYRSLNGRSGHRFGHATERFEVGGEMQFAAPHGYLVPPQWLAMWARRHQHVYGSTCEPFHLYDCCLEVDGAAAIVITTLERARHLAKPPVVIRGFAESHAQGGSWEQWPDLTAMYSARAAPKLWQRTGFSARDVNVACMYDCFTYTVMATMEDYGFCPKGEAGPYFGEGRATYGGDVVVNPHGGLLSEGYIHGMNHVLEGVRQIRGESTSQVPGAEVCLVTSTPLPPGSALILRAA